jgi:hypothetical protein
VARTTTVAAVKRSARRRAELSLSVSHQPVPAHDAAGLPLPVAAAATSASSLASMSIQRTVIQEYLHNRLPTCQMTSHTLVDLRRVELFRKAAKRDSLTAGAKVQRASGVNPYCGLGARPRKPPGLNSRGRRSRIPRIARQAGSSRASLLALRTRSASTSSITPTSVQASRNSLSPRILLHTAVRVSCPRTCARNRKGACGAWKVGELLLSFRRLPPDQQLSLYSTCLGILRSRLSWPICEHAACLRMVGIARFF